MLTVLTKVIQCTLLFWEGRNESESESQVVSDSLQPHELCRILLAIILEWVAFPFSRGSSQPRDGTQVSCIEGRFFNNWAWVCVCVCVCVCIHTYIHIAFMHSCMNTYVFIHTPKSYRCILLFWEARNMCYLASLVAQLVMNLPAMQETWIPSPGWEDPLEKKTATHSSILAWIITWTV